MKYTMKSDGGSLGESFKTVGTEHAWEGQELEVKGEPMFDTGTGPTIILRMFQYGANTENLKRDKPTKAQLFESHRKQIETMLWSDGLMPLEGQDPKVTTSKKKDMYRIFVTCRARNGMSIMERPTNLQDLSPTRA